MTGDEIRDVDVGIFNQNPFVESINSSRRKEADQRPLYRGDSYTSLKSRTSVRRRSSLLLDKVLRRGSYNFNNGEDNPAFSMKKGASVSSSIYSSSSYSSDELASPKLSPNLKATWFIGSKEIEMMEKQRISEANPTGSNEQEINFCKNESLPDEIRQMEVVENINLTEEEIKNYFSFFNISNDGFISKRQLKRSMEILGLELTEEDLDIMIQTADLDSDGLISLEDFKSLPFITCNIP